MERTSEGAARRVAAFLEDAERAYRELLADLSPDADYLTVSEAARLRALELGEVLHRMARRAKDAGKRR